MKPVRIYTPLDALDVIERAGINRANWALPCEVDGFAAWLWLRSQTLSPVDIPARLAEFAREQFPNHAATARLA